MTTPPAPDAAAVAAGTSRWMTVNSDYVGQQIHGAAHDAMDAYLTGRDKASTSMRIAIQRATYSWLDDNRADVLAAVSAAHLPTRCACEIA